MHEIQLAQAVTLVTGHGVIVAEFFDVGENRTLARKRSSSMPSGASSQA